MTIHHSQVRKAEKLGVQLTEEGDTVRAFWPKRALVVVGASPSDALAQVQAAIALIDGLDYRMVPATDEPRLVYVYKDDSEAEVLVGCPMPPVAAHKAIVIAKDAVWAQVDGETSETETWDDTPGNTGGYDGPFGASGASSTVSETVKTVDRINGIATNGAVAYSEGTPAGDCPYNSETEDDEEYAHFERWNEEWDAAADAAEAEDDSKGGSVVSEKYRAKYAELGHPTHCGDWLANLLNNLCLTKKDTDLERFETICQANGVDTSKYKRDGVGWQGRIRMTGRNLLAKQVYLAGGVIKTPVEGADPEYRAPADWMAAQRFKMPKSEQAAPIPAPAAA